jgi:hypothetical protein
MAIFMGFSSNSVEAVEHAVRAVVAGDAGSGQAGGANLAQEGAPVFGHRNAELEWAFAAVGHEWAG